MRRPVIAFIVAAVVLSTAAVAWASTVRQTSGSVDIAPAQTGEAKAGCGALKRLGTGKVSLVGAGFSGPQGIVNQGLQPLRRRALAEFDNNGTETARAKVFGYCTKRVPTTIRRQRSALLPGQVHNVFINCDKGETVLAGGWTMLDPEPVNWQVVNSLRQGRGTWVISVAADGAGTVRGFAVCTTKDLPIIARRSQPIPPIPGGVSTARIQCPQGTAALSGGYETGPDEGTVFANLLAVISSRRGGARTWAVQAAAELGSEFSVRAHAYCIDQPKG
jgi:hypothetical protein